MFGVVAAVLALALVLAPERATAGAEAGWRAYTAGDYAAAIREWQPLAEAGDAHMAFALGMAWQTSGDRAKALPWYEQAARAGIADAQILLGTLYAQGLDVPRDRVRAYAWLRVAERRGRENARLMLNALVGGMTDAQITDGEALGAEFDADMGESGAGAQ